MKLPHTDRARLLFTSGLLLFLSHSATALPVFPGAVGFGTNTPAGRGGTVYKVTNLNDSGPGSLRQYAQHTSGPRVIVFEVSGVIELQSDIIISSPFITIAGQTAPPPGITLKNAGFWPYTSDILIQHIGIRPGNLLPPLGNRDAIKIGAGPGTRSERIVVDHVTCSWAVDETVSVWSDEGEVSDVTISNSIIAHPLINGGNPSGSAGYGLISGRNVTNVTIARNLMAFNFARNPLVRDTTNGAQVVNNFVYRPGTWPNSVMRFGDLTEEPQSVSVIGNVIKRHPIPFTIDRLNTDTNQIEPFTYSTYYNTGIYVNDDVVSGAAFYVADNRLFNPQTSTWFPTDGDPYSSAIFSDNAPDPVDHLSADPYANSGGTNWSAWPSNDVEANLLASAGKQAVYRDYYDAALIDDILSGGGQFLEYLADLGTDPWDPVDIQTTRSLTLPTTNWSQDSDSDGYTDIEEWLHEWSALVEGTASDPEVIITDSFEDGQADGWTEYGTHNWQVVTVSGNDVYRQDNTVTAAVSILDGTNWDDYSVEAKTRVLGFSNTSDSLVSLYARQVDPQNYYTYMLLSDSSGNTVAAIKKRVNGTVTQLGSTVPYAFNENTWYTLKFEVSGATLKGYINGVEVISRTDSSLESGSAGLNTWKASAEFDDVVATPAGLGTTTGAAMSDTFEDGNANGWTPYGTHNWQVVQDAGNHVYQQDNTVTAAVSILDGTNWDDYSVEAKARVLGFSNSSDSLVSLFARHADPQNYYTYMLLSDSSGNTVAAIKKRVNNTVTQLGSTVPYAISENTWYTLKFEVSGTTLKGYINGAEVISRTDASLASGSAGLNTWKASAQFDDVAVHLPGVVEAVDDFEDGNAAGWATSTGSWSVTTDGSLVYRQSATTGLGQARIDAGDADQSIETAVKPNAHNGSPVSCGVVARWVDGSNHYYLGLYNDDTLRLGRMINGTGTNLASVPFAVSTGTWYTLKLTAVGDTLLGYVNGQLLVQATDSTHNATTVGLSTWKTDASYDGVVVESH